jgi:hypothetical protein
MNDRCACGSSGAAVCGAGGVMAWERGRGEGREGAEGVDVDYTHFRPPQERVAPPEAGARTIGPLAGALRRGTPSRRYCLVTTA